MLQAEAELISRVLQSRRFQRVLAAGVKAEHFAVYRPEWEYLLDQWHRHSEIPSAHLFKEKFPDFPYYKVVGADPSVTPAIEAVREAFLERSLARTAEEFVNALGNDKPDELLAKVRASLESINSQDSGEEQVDIIADIESDIREFERLQRAESEGETAFIPSPWEPINERWGGLRGGELIGVLARANEGKSWTSLQIATKAAKAGYRPLYVALEMGRFEVAARLHSILSYYIELEKSPKHLRLTGPVSKSRIKDMMEGRTVWRNTHIAMGHDDIDVEKYREWAAYAKQAAPKGFVMPLVNGSTGRFDVDTFIRHVERSECDIAVLDYLTLLEQPRGRGQGDWEVWRDVTRRLKLEAMRLGIPIIVCAQANRSGATNRTPELTDVAFSDAFAQNADRILSIKQQGTERTAITCIKNRIGDNRFRFWLNFHPEWGVLEYDPAAGVEENFDA